LKPELNFIDSTYLGKINQAINSIHNGGAMAILSKKWLKSEHCNKKKDSQQLTMKSIGGIFILFTSGVSASILVFIFARIQKIFLNKNTKNI